MTGNVLSSEVINDKTKLARCRNGYWLYDENRGMNLSMRAKTEKQALVEALEYYQRRLLEVEEESKNLKGCVERFLENLGIEDFDI